MQGRALVVFDFDHSLVPDNSDTWILERLGAPLTDDRRRAGPQGWTALMDWALGDPRCCVGPDALREAFAAMPFEPAMRATVEALAVAGHELVIVSDANTEYIRLVLEHAGLQTHFARVVSNPAHWEAERRLRVHPYHNNTWCTLCPSNLCKGRVLEDESRPFAYVGDGKGDICPSRRAQRIFARRDLALHRHFRDDARCVAWDSAEQLQQCFREAGYIN